MVQGTQEVELKCNKHIRILITQNIHTLNRRFEESFVTHIYCNLKKISRVNDVTMTISPT